MKAYDLRFSDRNAGAGSQSLGLQQPQTLSSGQTKRVNLTDAEAAHFIRDEAYTLSIPKIVIARAENDGETGFGGGETAVPTKPKKKAIKALKE